MPNEIGKLLQLDHILDMPSYIFFVIYFCFE